ncbi:unnamed protein product [Schistocephalus solidus]|uniref:Endo/exonuclease/phosphatase domain-containing protein n=1 Tax=Schistocephalus solidus TaxID=70667 RepID=A0A3P7DML0_SCHSO|nr:unnamed protein product [Schistocephalus solidus]
MGQQVHRDVADINARFVPLDSSKFGSSQRPHPGTRHDRWAKPVEGFRGCVPPHPAARMRPLTLAAWNFRTLQDNRRNNRPKRMTALVARELARYKVDIAALSETRFSEQGQLEEVGAGYTFFCSGRPKAEQRDACFIFAIRNDIVGHLPCLPQDINDRLMNLRLPFWGDQFACAWSPRSRLLYR